MLPVSLECPFLIVLSVFSNFYLKTDPYLYISTFPNVDFRRTKTTKNNYVTEQICLTTNISYNHKHYNIVSQWVKYPGFYLELSVFHAIYVFEFAQLGK